jgi:hypothetical protein
MLRAKAKLALALPRIVNYDGLKVLATVITIVNYDCNTFIAVAISLQLSTLKFAMTSYAKNDVIYFFLELTLFLQVPWLFYGRHDTQHNDTKHNGRTLLC